MSKRSLLGLVVLIAAVSGATQWWSSRHQQSLGQQLAAIVKPGDLHMISSDTCAICVSARYWLNQHAVPFTECSIERDSACAQQYQASLSPGTPVMLVRGQFQVGFNAQRLLLVLQRES